MSAVSVRVQGPGFGTIRPCFVGIALLLLALLPSIAGPFLVSPEMAEVFGGIPNLPPGRRTPARHSE